MPKQKSLADRFGDPYGTLIDPGEYRCFYRGWEPGYFHGTERIFCWFTIAPDQTAAEKPLIRFYNAIRKSFIPRSHNIARDFYAATGRRPPSNVRPDDYLLDCEVLAKVVTVHDKDQRPGGNVSQDDLGPPYSKIGAILKVTAGTPPCLQKRGHRAS